MKPSAHFVNVGRGETVRLDDLTGALESGTIAGAAIDVSEIEPLPGDHRLWRAPNVVITPHVSGMTDDDRHGGMSIFCRNLRAWLDGIPLQNAVDWARGY